jgi:hypothetical protein
MDKKPLIVVSLCAVVLLVLGSLSNVVGYQTVQSSNQSVIKERINQRELLFQTIVDIANNKEIQRIILKSQMSRGIFPTSDIPVLTKSQIRQMYLVGLLLSRFISKSRIQSMIGKYQFSNQETQKEISAIIQKDATLKGQIDQLTSVNCNCKNTKWYPTMVICTILETLLYGILMPIDDYLYQHGYDYLLLLWLISTYPIVVVGFTLFVIICLGSPKLT